MRKSTDLNMTATATFSDRGSRIEPNTLAARFHKIVNSINYDQPLIEVSKVQRAALLNLHAQMSRKQTGK